MPSKYLTLYLQHFKLLLNKFIRPSIPFLFFFIFSALPAKVLCWTQAFRRLIKRNGPLPDRAGTMRADKGGCDTLRRSCLYPSITLGRIKYSHITSDLPAYLFNDPQINYKLWNKNKTKINLTTRHCGNTDRSWKWNKINEKYIKIYTTDKMFGSTVFHLQNTSKWVFLYF